MMLQRMTSWFHKVLFCFYLHFDQKIGEISPKLLIHRSNNFFFFFKYFLHLFSVLTRETSTSSSWETSRKTTRESSRISSWTTLALFLLTKSSKINSEKIHFCVWNYGISIFKWFYIACSNANFVLKYLYCETWLNWTPNKTEFSINRNLNSVMFI